MSWTTILSDAGGIDHVYGGYPPELAQVRLHEVTVHRDGPRVTLRLDLPLYPQSPPKKWLTQGFNTVQINLMLVGVRGISLLGFSANPLVDVEIRETGSGCVEVKIDAPELKFSATGMSLLVSNVSAYMDG
ncbi:Imm50 family immunity protein [Streptomyces sp. JJ36]|uniref:Imm50 family immunity protein n=1 Tax=Streptomyces sp. JJ36 TaxID=2736645 RepID=UPI001F45D701|nr:Imm50 family immunity protein [Streptomyces sp. JJ36]MCF6525064.1 hypothetical protein [Streptomyces sp. JJ36]